MIKKERYIGTGIDQDTAPDKRKADVYWDAENIRIINNGRSLSIKPIHGSEILIPANLFPDNLNGFCVVGNSEINSNLYLFITNNTGTIDAPNPSPCKNYLIEVTPEGVVSVILSNSSGALNTEYNIPGIYSLTIPEGVTSITVGCYGGGAAGMHGSSLSGRGGAGGSYAESTLSVTPGQIYTIIVADETLPSSLPDVSVAGNPSAFSFGITDLVKAFGGNADGSSTGDDNIGNIIFNSPSVISGNGSNAGGPIGGLQGTGGAGGDGKTTIDGSAGTYAGGGGGRGVEDIYSPGIYGVGGVGASGAVTISMISISVSTEDFKLSCQNELDVVANYENEDIIKLYWTDGITPLKFINVQNPSNAIQVIEEVALSNVDVTLQPGGSLIAGNIQYAYNLYNLNGSESSLSPLSKVVSISENMKGFESGKSTGLSCSLSINISGNFTYIKIYSIHYQELNQTPKITLIADSQITSPSTYNMVDDGNVVISTLSVNEFNSIGGRYLITKTISNKRNRLFLGNYSIENFDFEFDARAFSCRSGTYYYRLVGDATEYRNDFGPDLPEETNDCINYDYSVYRFTQGSSSKYGATGQYVELSITLSTLANTTAAFNTPSLKKGEIYRFGLLFINKYGQKSPVKWIADLKIPYGLTGSRNKIAIPQIQLVNGGPSLALASGAVSYQLVMVERKPWDRTIISQGFLVPTAKYKKISDESLLSPYNHPWFGVKDIFNSPLTGMVMGTPYTSGKDWAVTPINMPEEVNSSMCFYSSDTLFEESIDSAESIIPIGTNTLSDTFNTTRVLGLDSSGATLSDTVYPTFKLDGYGIGTPNLMAAIGNGYIPCIFFTKNYNGIGAEPDHTAIDLEENSMFIKEGDIEVFNVDVTLANTVQIPDLCNDGAAPYGNYIHKFPNCILLHFSSPTWHYQGMDAWGKFIVGGADTFRRLPIVDLYRTLANQYGGGSYEAKQRNEYLIVGSLRDITGAINTEIGMGDIYLSPLSINRCDPENYLSDRYWNIYEYIKLDYIENNHNVFGRSDNMDKWSYGLNTNTNYSFYRIEDNHKLLGAYNQKPTLVKAFSKPANFNTVDRFKASIQASNEKFPNEVIDSWLKFPVNETRNLEGIYGQINKLYNFKGEILSFQDSGVALISINPRIQTQAVDGVNIELGIGAVLYDHKYITTVAGCVDKNTVIDDGTSLFYYDRKTNTINVVEQDKLSTALSVREIMEQHPNQLISAAYHRNMDEVLFVFDTFSLVYNSLIKKFISKYTHETPIVKRHINFGNKLLFLKPGDGFMEKYASNDVLPSSITYMMCPFPSFEKVFHNLEYRLVGDNFDKLEVTSPYGASGELDLVSYNKFGVYRTHLPRKEMSIERFREIYIFVKLIHEGILDYALDDVTVMFDVKG